MDISGIGSTGATYGTQGVGQHNGRQVRSKVETAVAQKLNLSVDDLRKQLASGKSMTDIASAQGVSRDDLVSTISGALQSAGVGSTSATSTAAATLTSSSSAGTQSTDLTAMAGQIADRVGGAHHHHRHGQGTSATDSAATTPPPLPQGAPDSDGDQDGSSSTSGSLSVSL